MNKKPAVINYFFFIYMIICFILGLIAYKVVGFIGSLIILFFVWVIKKLSSPN